MTNAWTWRRLFLPLGTGLAVMCVVGVECQYEPLPDERRGWEGDKCREGNQCEPGLVCDLLKPPRCRKACNPQAANACAACEQTQRCVAVLTPDGGTDPSNGGCLPGSLEGKECGIGCAGCLLCAAENENATPTCRRQCKQEIDAGPADLAITGLHRWCTDMYPDLPETGNIIKQNCCPYGQTCTPVQMGSDIQAAACFGPAPGELEGSCKPGRKCNSATLVCRPGDMSQSIPDVCKPAGGPDQYCRSNNTCDSTTLVCISDPQYGTLPICRRRCETGEATCRDCGDGFDCVQIQRETPGRGACVPAAREGEECGGRGCARCLVCGGMAGADGGPVCRRPCFPQVDAGTPDAANVGPHEYCPEPDAEGMTIMRNCCPLGQMCLTFVGGTGAACY